LISNQSLSTCPSYRVVIRTQIHEILLRTGVLTVNEVRQMRGLAAL